MEGGDEDFGGSEKGGGGDDGDSGGSEMSGGGGGKDFRQRRVLKSKFEEFLDSYDRSKSLEDRLTITVGSNSKLDEETAKELQEYTWKIVTADSNQIEIKIEFKHTESVSSEGTDPAFVQVQAFFSDFEPNWNDELVLIRIDLPKQKKEL